MISKEMEQKIDAYVAENKENILNDIASLIEIPSVSIDGEAGTPFGPECKRVLDKALSMCSAMGMATKNYDYYAGSASIGTAEKEISVMGHLDVVPAGNGWSSDPYKMVIKDGYIYGRGVADDKGPVILGLYALKFLKDNNIPLNYTYRLVMGCSEERGMGDVDAILSKEKVPTFMFTPDAEFPLIHGEKGIMSVKARFPHDGKTIANFHGGLVSNMVADRATADLKGVTRAQLGDLDPKVFDVEETADGVSITAKGVGTHASIPEDSINAIYLLADMLSKADYLSAAEKDACAKLAATLSDYNGKGLGIDCEDEPSGKITHVSGIVTMEGNDIVADYNIRYPVTAKGCELKARLEQYSKEHGFQAEVMSDSKPSYRSAEAPEIQALMAAYRDVTGDQDAQPMVIGGGTYARNFPNAVAFGPCFLDMPNPAGENKGGIHMADECTDIGRMMIAVKIYIRALLNLNELSL